MKVFGIAVMARQEWTCEEQQPRVVVAASSQKKATAAMSRAGLSMNLNHLATYGGQTWNALEIEVASTKPGAVFYATTRVPQTVHDWAEAPEEGP